jgi:predicted GNAT superfamily acetyltransferase
MLSFAECHKLVQKDIRPEEYQKFMNSIRYEVQNLLALGRRHVTKYNQDEIEVYVVFNNVQLRDKVFDSQERQCCQNKVITSKGEYEIV